MSHPRDRTDLRYLLRVVSRIATVWLIGSIVLLGCGDETPAADDPRGDPCVDSTTCAGGLVCAAGSCQEPGSAGLGGPCWANRDCEDGLFCSPDAVCAPAGPGGVGDSCLTGAECTDDLVCELSGLSGTCQVAGAADVGQSCRINLDCLAGLVCAPDSTCQHPSVAYPPFALECGPNEAPFRAYFEVPRSGQTPAEFFRLPFPNDVRVSAAGALDMRGFPRPGPSSLGIDLVSLYVDTWVESFAGFGATAPVTFRFSEPFDPDTLDPIVVDITAGTPEYNTTQGRSYRFSSAAGAYRCQNAVAVRTRASRPLRPGHTYAYYFSRDTLRSAAGGVPEIDPDLAAVLASSRPADADLGAAWDRFQPFRDYLADTGIAPSTIATAAVVTVGDDTVGRDKALADHALSLAPPALSDLTLCDGSTASPCGECGPVSADFHEIHGRVAIPFYQRGTPPFETPEDGGDIELVDGVPRQAGSQSVCFALAIPKSAPMPQGGWPLVVSAHGTGGSFSDVISSGLAEALTTTAAPAAVLGFDGVLHGDRKGDSDRDPSELVFNIFNPAAARDNHAQGMVDVVTLMRLPELGTVTLPGAGDVSFDAGRVLFFGHSQGSNVGIPAVAVTDQALGAIVSGAGGHLATGMLTKTSPIQSKAALEFLVGEELDLEHPVMMVIQSTFSTVEVASFAPLLITRPESIGLTPKNVWMSYGLGDTFSPPETLAVTALAAGLDVVTPVLEDFGAPTVDRPVSQNRRGTHFGACFQYAPTGVDGHFVALVDPAAIADWLAFTTSLLSTNTATVP